MHKKRLFGLYFTGIDKAKLRSQTLAIHDHSKENPARAGPAKVYRHTHLAICNTANRRNSQQMAEGVSLQRDVR